MSSWVPWSVGSPAARWLPAKPRQAARYKHTDSPGDTARMRPAVLRFVPATPAVTTSSGQQVHPVESHRKRHETCLFVFRRFGVKTSTASFQESLLGRVDEEIRTGTCRLSGCGHMPPVVRHYFRGPSAQRGESRNVTMRATRLHRPAEPGDFSTHRSSEQKGGVTTVRFRRSGVTLGSSCSHGLRRPSYLISGM
ncbi:hypothetical protein Bbelb_142610 [Branchiostoma belcheri]|nr:hypothetical protein Bbelb_142610 [Branchiostoma belcheri]